MPICFWKLCHCPDQQPCVEHVGIGCSILNGRAIAVETDVDDPVTRAAEVAIAQLERDRQRVDEIRRRLEDRKAQLERERQELEQQAAAADSRRDRRAVVEKERELARRHEHLSDELVALTDEIDALGNSAMTAMATVSGALKIPYSDPTGYCACYDDKLRQLSALAAQIMAELATLAAAMVAYNAARAAAIPKLRVTFTIALLVFLLMFIFLSLGAALVVGGFLALMFTAITVVGLAFQMAVRRAAMLQSRLRLLKLRLSYYRIQQIPTCQPADEDDDDERDRDEGDDDGDARAGREDRQADARPLPVARTFRSASRPPIREARALRHVRRRAARPVPLQRRQSTRTPSVLSGCGRGRSEPHILTRSRSSTQNGAARNSVLTDF